MGPTPLETAVREHFRQRFGQMAGRSRFATPEVMEQLIEKKSVQVLAVLRETLSDDTVPDEDQLHRATMEATHREIEGLIGTMRSARPADPLRQRIITQLADDAEASLVQRRTVGPYPTEEQLAEFAKSSTESFQRLTQMVRDARKGDTGEPPTS